MREVVHSILENTPEAAAHRIENAPGAAALLELRADHLRSADAAGLVRRAGRPVVVTVRSTDDGGAFDGSTEEKRAILDAALHSGCAFVDVEWDGPLRELAFGPWAPRLILSHHGAPCELPALVDLFDAMAASRAARLKIVPRALRASEPRAVRDLLTRAREGRRELCAFATGACGTWSRIAAPVWGSWGTYGAAAPDRQSGAGQLLTREMLEVYRVLELSDATQWFGLCGAPLSGSPSPAVHAAGYSEVGLNAVYVPVETEDLAEIAAIVEDGLLPLSGFGVTIPLKEDAARRCVRLDSFAACGSANTVVVGDGTWEGFNTDAPAALALIREHLDPRGALAAVVGAGGTARAIASALKEAGALVTLYNRSTARGDATGRAIGVPALPLSALAGARWDLLVHATPIGRNGDDLLHRRHLAGRVVLDAAYGAEPTPLVRDARARGLKVIDGLDLLAAQAALQFTRLTGRPAPTAAMAAALEPWRASSSA